MANVASLGFDVRRLQAQKKLFIDWIRVERSEIEESGEFDLEGLFVRLEHAIHQVGAKRVALDTVESLFSTLPNPVALRSELRRLFRWLKDRGVTAVITGEKGERTLTRYGLEEYVSDCVIFLDHWVNEQESTRRLRIVKYRGSTDGTNEYPFLIDENGISVLPITSLAMNQLAPRERVTTGIERLDAMLVGKGYFRGSTVLVTGTAGTGKTSIAAALARATCENRRRCLYLAFEESAAQLTRNMRSVGIDLDRYLKNGTRQLIRARSLVAHRHLALARGDPKRRRAQPGAHDHQVAWDGALEPERRVSPSVEDAELERAILEEAQRGATIASDRMSMASSRHAFSTARAERNGTR